MNRILFIITTLLLYTFCSCSNNKKSTEVRDNYQIYSANILFKDSIYDFNTLALNNNLYSYTFRFENNGKVPAVILNVAPSCRCTSVKYNKSPIPVGGEDSITIFFNSIESGIGYFNKEVKIRINSPEVYTLRIKGQVK